MAKLTLLTLSAEGLTGFSIVEMTEVFAVNEVEAKQLIVNRGVAKLSDIERKLIIGS